MSHALSRQDPYRWPAGALALAVHAAFFVLLVFGVRWQSQPPENFSVELWNALPSVETIAPPNPVVVAPPPQNPAAKSELPPAHKTEIQLREKKAVKDEPRKPSAAEVRARREEQEKRQLEEYVEKRRQTEQARVRAENDAATAAELGRYQDMIRSKIRRNIVMPPDVPASAVAEFQVTLLPGGMVMDAVLLKSSGNTAYDNAAERAIYKAQPLPLPADAGLQKMFRDLHLTVRP